MSSQLNTESRSEALRRLASSTNPGEELDVLVIGGGVTGAGIALDAASRGLSTAVVEAQDWSAGTSSRSSKLVHGGLRYLQMLDFKLVLEALRERDLLLTRVAPHLVHALPFLYPLRYRVVERAFVGSGILLYDLLASLRPGRRALPFHRHLSKAALKATFPDLAHKAAIGAIEYWDASVDDARFVLTLIRTARSHGAHAATRTEVVELTKGDDGAVNGAILQDLETGTTFPVRARCVISATGVWTEESQALAGDRGGLRVQASKGIHIVVRRERIAGDAGLILQTSKSVLFVIPWSRYWVIGTTDTPWSEDVRDPVANAADIEYVLMEANKVLAEPLSARDIIGTWAGLRPLLQPGTKSGTQSSRVSREHTVASSVPGLVSIAGGKFTTYRVMAKDAVDFALGKQRVKTMPSSTADIPLIGAVGSDAIEPELQDLIDHLNWNQETVDHLLHRYGSNIRDIAEIALSEAGLAVPLVGAPAYLGAEIAYAITHEGALHLDDLMERRTRMVYEYPEAAMAALPEVAEIATRYLKWTRKHAAHEIATYTNQAAAAAAAALQRDDRSAARVRGTAAPNVEWSAFAKPNAAN
jgi:glycerol-3-phosphate dehydrogenase